MVRYGKRDRRVVEGQLLMGVFDMKREIQWPDRNQSAAMISIMLDCEYIWLDMDPLYDTPKHRSMGEYGPKRGVDNILAALDDYHVKATFFVPGIVAENYPETVMKIANAGHEIALHGYAHENFSHLTPEEQREAIRKGIDAVEKVIHKKPVGFRLPEGDCTPETFDIIKEFNFLYDSSLFDNDIPYITGNGTNKMTEIPMRWEMVDFTYLAWGGIFPAGACRVAVYDDVLDNWLRELNAFYDMGLCYVITWTPQTIGSPGRMFMVEKVLEQMTRKNIWVATGESIANYMLNKDQSEESNV